jgi:hypothetical protein
MRRPPVPPHSDRHEPQAGVHAPQSLGQTKQPSFASQMPLPQGCAQGPQSAGQFEHVSPDPQTPLPHPPGPEGQLWDTPLQVTWPDEAQHWPEVPTQDRVVPSLHVIDTEQSLVACTKPSTVLSKTSGASFSSSGGVPQAARDTSATSRPANQIFFMRSTS